MKNRIITISREFGSGGRYIGEETAKKLGIAYYDKEIIAKTAEATGFSQDFIEKKGEYSPTKSLFAYAFVGRDSLGSSTDDYLYKVQRDIIMELAEREPCVIVGRCADYILKDREDCINIFLHGEKKEKIERIQEICQVSPAEAEKRIKDMDKKRSVHYKYYTDREWGNVKNYALTLNSSVLGYEKCIELIADIYR